MTIGLPMRWTAMLACMAAISGCGPVEGGAPDAEQSRLLARRSRSVLYAAAESGDPVTRSRAIECLAAAEGAKEVSRYRRALRSPSGTEQFAAAMAVGDYKVAEAMGDLRSMAASNRLDNNARCAVIYALHQLGDDTYTGQLGRLLQHPDAEVRANAALVMAKIGHPSAAAALRQRLMVENHPGVRLQIGEGLAMFGDESSIRNLRWYVRAPNQPHERLLAVEALGRTKDPESKSTLIWAMREDQPPLLRLAAARALAEMGDMAGLALAVEAAGDPAGVAQQSYTEQIIVPEAEAQQIQHLAALALGEMGEVRAVAVLEPLLDSPSEIVKLSAARSTLVLLHQAGLGELPVEPVDTPPPPSGPAALSGRGPAAVPAAQATTPQSPAAANRRPAAPAGKKPADVAVPSPGLRTAPARR